MGRASRRRTIGNRQLDLCTPVALRLQADSQNTSRCERWPQILRGLCTTHLTQRCKTIEECESGQANTVNRTIDSVPLVRVAHRVERDDRKQQLRSFKKLAKVYPRTHLEVGEYTNLIGFTVGFFFWVIVIVIVFFFFFFCPGPI